MRISSSLWFSSITIFGSSLTPFSSTIWLPMEQPASASRRAASKASAVHSFGWLKWVFTKTGWCLRSMRTKSSVTRWGSVTRLRVPSRKISTWGMARSRPRM